MWRAEAGPPVCSASSAAEGPSEEGAAGGSSSAQAASSSSRARRRHSFKATFKESRKGTKSRAQQHRGSVPAPPPRASSPGLRGLPPRQPAAGQEEGWQLLPLGGRRRSSEVGYASFAEPAHRAVGLAGAQRKARRDAFEADLLGRFDRQISGESSGGAVSSKAETAACGAPAPAPHAAEEDGLGVVVAFVARRVYRRLREGSAAGGAAGNKPGARRAPLLGIFDEHCFDGLRAWRWARSHRKSRRRRGGWASCVDFCFGCCQPDEPPGVADVFDFLLGFATWCAFPPDLVVVALVYMDRLLDRCAFGTGSLTVRSWRPIMTVCLLLASKMWEDWCVCNAEVAQFAGYACESLLCWELAALEMLDWEANISADVFAPYFWAVERVRRDGRDEQVGRLTAPLSQPDRTRLAKLADQVSAQPTMAGTLWAAKGGKQQAPAGGAPRRRKGPSAAESLATQLARRGGALESIDEVRRRVGAMDEPMRSKFAFAARLEDRYRFLKSMGRGSFGEVKLAARAGDDTVLAVKVFGHAPRSWLRASDILTESFVLSGIAASLNHSNVVRFQEFVVDEGRFLEGREQFILPVMEALLGPDLFDWLAARQEAAVRGTSGWISRLEAWRIALQVASALAYIHSNVPTMVHRDVKPENLRWAAAAAGPQEEALPTAPLKLVDFGTVYVEGFQDALGGRPVGTALYMAPEAFARTTGDASAAAKCALPEPSLDMFSLGVVLLLLLSGNLPQADGDAGWASLLQADGDAPMWNKVPEDAADLVRGLLAPLPRDRPTAQQVLEALSPCEEAGDEGDAKRAPLHDPLPLPAAPLTSLRARSAASNRGSGSAI